MKLPRALSGVLPFWRSQGVGSILSKRAGLAGFATFFVLGSVTYLGMPSRGDTHPQPIAFNHAKHVENGVSCADCHAGVETQAKATLPELDVCMGCHQTAMGSSPEEAKVRAIADKGQELHWTQVTQNPPHVFFSHRRHVAVAHLACAECHGPMEKATQPPQRPFRVLNMNACIGCHQKHGLNADCNDCHR